MMSKNNKFIKSFVNTLIKKSDWKDWLTYGGAGLAGAGLGGLGTYLVKDYFEDIEDEKQEEVLDAYIDAAQDTLGGLQSDYGDRLMELKEMANKAQQGAFQQGIQEGMRRALRESSFRR